MARGSAQNAKGNKANNQPASAKGAGSHLRANKGHESEFDDFEPLVEPSANRDIAGVVIAVLAIASFIAVISPATAPVTAAVAGFYHLGFGLGAYVLPIVILLFAATLFLGEDSPLNVRSVAGGAVVFITVVSILSLMVPGTSDSCDLMFTPQNLSASGATSVRLLRVRCRMPWVSLSRWWSCWVWPSLVLSSSAFRWVACCALLATARPILPSAVVPMLTRARGVTTKPCRCPALPVRT